MIKENTKMFWDCGKNAIPYEENKVMTHKTSKPNTELVGRHEGLVEEGYLV